jgi:TP901 family phage tail tape measure protein
MAKPYEQDVVLDADGRPLFNAIELLERKIGNIAKTIKNIERDTFKTAKDFNTTIDANIKALQRSMSQMRTINNLGATERRQQLALAGSQAQRDRSKFGDSTRARYEYDLEQKLLKLRHAANEEEKLAGLNAVRLAEARLTALGRIEAAERRIANEQRRAQGGDAMTVQRQQLALSRQYAEQQRQALGTTEALARQKALVLSAEQKLAGASTAQSQRLRQQLELENARLRAIQRVANEEARASRAKNGNGPVGPKGPESRIGNILSPGYAGAAFARTSVYGAAAMAAYGMFNAFTEAAGGVVALEDAMFRLQAISNSTDTQMQTLKGTIYALGKDSRFSLTELAEAATVLAQAGVSAGQMESVLRSVTTLATASGSTIDEAAQLVTSAVGSFQLQASEAGRVADLMVNALNRTKLTVQQTGQAIQYVGATAFEQNISLEQLLATIGAVAQAGVRSGSTIGTGFRQFLVDMADPSKKLTEQLELLGLKTSDVNVAVRGLPAVLETLQKAGFGAAQAYEGLEVRAAAFYLIAKNNVDIMDQLQLSFATQGAAAAANERAMSSLAAQWQRFKNILAGGLAEGMENTMAVLRDLIRNVSDRVEEMQKIAEERRDKQSKGRAGYAPGFGGAFEYALNYNPAPILEGGLERLFNGQLMPGYEGKLTNLGTAMRNLGKDSEVAAAGSERLRTKIAETNDKITEQRSQITELDKELLRLITQKESLRDNEVRTATETATLSSRFQGLALELGNTGNAYDNLVGAMKRYRQQQVNLLNTSLLAQESNLTVQTAQSRTNSLFQGATLLRDKDFMAAAGPRVGQAIQTAASAAPGSREFLNAVAILNDAVRTLSVSNLAQAQKLSNMVGSLGTIATNTSELRSIRLQNEDNVIASTEVGQYLVNTQRDVEAMIAQISAMSNDETGKGSLTNKALTNLSTMDRKIAEVLGRSLSDQARRWLMAQQTVITSMTRQVKALNAPTADEKREQQKAEREANKGKLLTQAELDSIGQRVLGLAPGSGVRSAALQNALHAQGRTRATAATSSHSNGGLARDFPTAGMTDAEGERLATTLRNHFKNIGVDVFVKYETGRGRNQGTGPHIHTSARRGTRWKGSAAGDDQAALDQFAAQMDASQLELDKREFNEALKDLTKATTEEAMTAALARAKAAMDKVNAGLRSQAENELSKAGIGPGTPMYQQRFNQLEDAIAQNADEYNRKVTEATIKATKAILKGAQEAFEKAMAPSQRNVAMAEGVVSGLGYESLRGRVPDYTRALAEQQAARAREAADRARLANLPSLISAQQGQIAGLVAKRDASTDQSSIDLYNAQILELSNNVDQLTASQDALQAAFGAEGMIPRTFTEGLGQAIEAYRQLNGLNLTFTEQLNNEMTGAIGTVHQSLTEMFATVFDGSQSAGQAILGFAKAMMQAVAQIVAKIIATQIINLIGNLFSAAGGAFTGGPTSTPSGATSQGFTGPAAFLGKAIGRQHGGPTGYIAGGHSMRDNVLAKLAKGEWVVNKRAVDSVGHEFMADLNARGSTALNNNLKTAPSINFNPEQKVNVWVVKPDEKPQMGPNDVLVTWQDDVLRGGQSRRLIETIARDSR